MAKQLKPADIEAVRKDSIELNATLKVMAAALTETASQIEATHAEPAEEVNA